MDEMAAGMAQIAPLLWDLMDTLLLTHGMENTSTRENNLDNQDEQPEAEDELEGFFLNAAPGDRNHTKKMRQHDRKLALIQIVSTLSCYNKIGRDLRM